VAAFGRLKKIQNGSRCHGNLIFESLTIHFYFFYFHIGGHFENFKIIKHNFE
jgi:hypothetical protein